MLRQSTSITGFRFPSTPSDFLQTFFIQPSKTVKYLFTNRLFLKPGCMESILETDIEQKGIHNFLKHLKFTDCQRKSTIIQSRLLAFILSKRRKSTPQIIWNHYTISTLKFVVLYKFFKVRIGVVFDFP